MWSRTPSNRGVAGSVLLLALVLSLVPQIGCVCEPKPKSPIALFCSGAHLRQTHDALLSLFAPDKPDPQLQALIAAKSEKMFSTVQDESELRSLLTLLCDPNLDAHLFTTFAYYEVLTHSPAEDESVRKAAVGELRDFLDAAKKRHDLHRKPRFFELSADERKDLLVLLQRSPMSMYRRLALMTRAYYKLSLYAGEIGDRMAGIDSYLKPSPPPTGPYGLSLSSGLSVDQRKRTIEGDIDYVIVGSGPAGSVTASELSKAGYRVVLVDKGALYVPQKVDARFLFGFESVDSLTLDTTGSHVFAKGEFVGGGTFVNLDIAFPPILPQVWTRFAKWRDTGMIPASTWSEQEIRTSYQSVSEVIQTRTLAGADVNENNRVLQAGAALLGYSSSTYSLNNEKLEDDKINKRGALESYVWPSINRPQNPVVLVPRALARRVLFEGERAVGVEIEALPPETHEWAVNDPFRLALKVGARYEIRARNVILSAGSLGTAQLLLASGVENENIGRGMVTHPIFPVVGIFDRSINAYLGEPASVYVDQFVTKDYHAPKEDIVFEAASAPVSRFAMMMPGWGSDMAENLRLYSHAAGGGVVLFDRPNPENGITWKNGKLRIAYRLSDEDKRRFARGVARLADLLFAAGAKEVILPCYEVLFPDRGIFNVLRSREEAAAIADRLRFTEGSNILSSSHMMGTARMGTSPKTSVVNGDQQVWGHEGLYVNDASVLPESTGSNPMMTIYTIAHMFSRRHLARVGPKR